MPFLERTSFALEKTKEHLREINESGSGLAGAGEIGVIESYLVQYALVAFYSEVEEELADIVRARLSVVEDTKLETFLYRANEGMIKRTKTSEIRDFLKKFGCSPDDLLCDVEPRDLSYYGTAIANRHQVSHAAGSTMSLSQLELAVDAAKRILSSVQRCIQ